jgi:hypothetical protein
MDAGGASVQSLIQALCRLTVKERGKPDEQRGYELRRATATAYDGLLFWDGGAHLAGDDAGSQDHLLGVAAGVYSMRSRGLDMQATRLEELLARLSSSFSAFKTQGGQESADDGRAPLTFLPPGTRQRVLKLENVDAILSLLMLLRDSADEGSLPEDEEPPSPALPVRKIGESAAHTVLPLDPDAGGFTLYKDVSFSMVAGVGQHFIANAASLPGVDPAHERLLSQRPLGPEHAAQTTGGWLFGAVSHGLPPISQARVDSGIGALLSLPLLHETDTDALDLISRATTARASPAHQAAALQGDRGIVNMAHGGRDALCHAGSDSAQAAARPGDAISAGSKAGTQHAGKPKGQRNLWKELFESAGGARDGIVQGAHDDSRQDASGWDGGKVGMDWWEQYATGDGGGGSVPKPVSEGGVEEFDKFSRWMQVGAAGEGEYSAAALVSHDALVRDVVFLALGLASGMPNEPCKGSFAYKEPCAHHKEIC